MKEKSIIFFIFLITFSSISSLKNYKPNSENKKEGNLQKKSYRETNKEILEKPKNIKNLNKISSIKNINENEVDEVVSSFKEKSKKNPEQFYMLIFSTEDNQFPEEYKTIKNKMNVNKYNVKTDTKDHYTNIFVIQNGVVIDNKKTEINSKETQNYSEYLQKKYQFHTDSDSQFVYKSSEKQEFITLLQLMAEREKRKDKRLMRFIWAICLVLVFSVSLFLLVKYSIDWATGSKNEINKEKEKNLREVTETVIRDF